MAKTKLVDKGEKKLQSLDSSRWGKTEVVGENIIVIMRMRIFWSSLVRTNNKTGNKFV